MGSAAHKVQCLPDDGPETPVDKEWIPHQPCFSCVTQHDGGKRTLIGALGCMEKGEPMWLSCPHEQVPQPINQSTHLKFATSEGMHSKIDRELTLAFNRFTVAIVGINCLEKGMWKSGSDVCVLKMLGNNTEFFRTKIVDSLREPQWNEEVEVARTMDNESIEFLVYRQKTHFSFLMGRAVLDNGLFQSFGFNGEVELHDGKGMILGTLAVKVKMDGQQDFPEPVREDSEQSGQEDENSNEVALAVHGAPGKPVGLSVDIQDGITVYVSEVKEGPFLRYNRRIRCKDLQLKPGDFITRVNGVKGNSAKILEQLQLSGDMEVVACRPSNVVIQLKRDRPEQNFGILVTNHSIGRTLLLDGVMEGSPLQAWNLANPDDAIVAGDRVVAVNGQRGTAAQLMEVILNQKNECQVTFARRP